MNNHRDDALLVGCAATLQGCNGAPHVLVVTLNRFRALMMVVETPFYWDL